ncbi:MAG: hypothetical protein Q9159_006407 [Coniocarpon cinnabarinum]
MAPNFPHIKVNPMHAVHLHNDTHHQAVQTDKAIEKDIMNGQYDLQKYLEPFGIKYKGTEADKKKLNENGKKVLKADRTKHPLKHLFNLSD